MNEKYYKISQTELLDLLKVKSMLTALEFGGVDNWSWYDESTRNFLDSYKENNILNLPEEDLEDFYFDDIAKIEIDKYEIVK